MRKKVTIDFGEAQEGYHVEIKEVVARFVKVIVVVCLFQIKNNPVKLRHFNLLFQYLQ